MGLLDSLLGGSAGNSDKSRDLSPLVAVLGTLLAQNGGLQGLMQKFSQSGRGDAFASWVGQGQNQGLSPSQVRSALGHEQLNHVATQLGTSTEDASGFLATYLPKIIDQLTPSGQVPAGEENPQGLAAMLPSLLNSLGEQSPQA
ncbi:MAG: YidB family protein [Chthoniobacteraceae bacterium]